MTPAPMSVGEVLRRKRDWLVAQATRAPSVHNTQPWRFRFSPDGIDVVADLTRGLVVADADGRELAISCGAALFHLRLALRQLALRGDIQILPDRSDPRVLAHVTPIQAGAPTPDEEQLFAAIACRHTHRSEFDNATITPALAVRLQKAAGDEGAELRYVANPGSAQRVLHLARAAERQASADPHAREETANWTPDAGSTRRDGIPDRAYPDGPPASGPGELAGRDFDLARDRGRLLRGDQPSTPIAILLTEEDQEYDWIRAGQALAAILLSAATEGAFALLHSRVTEIPGLRGELRRELVTAAHPQILMRFGYADQTQATPRRAPADVIDLVAGSAGGSDAEIARLAQEWLQRAEGVPCDRVVAEVRDRVVTLSGTVGSGAERIAAERAVMYLPGVTQINNRVDVRHPS
jgi:nitroreductase